MVGSQQEVCALTAVEVVPPLRKVGSSTGLKARTANQWLQCNLICNSDCMMDPQSGDFDPKSETQVPYPDAGPKVRDGVTQLRT
jgi:hypothetical protein